MRVLSLSNRGIGRPYRRSEPTTLDLAALGPGLIAISGEKGNGKTFLIESLPAALYQDLPFRSPESVYKYASGRDAYAEAVLEDGGRTIRVVARFDAEKRKCERSLSVDREKPISGQKLFDAKVRELCGSYESFLATVFRPQSNKGNICSAPVAQRKELFGEFLGLVLYAEIAGRAQSRREAVERILDDIRREAADGEEQVKAIPVFERELAEAEKIAATTSWDVEIARRAETQATEEIATIKADADRRAEIVRAELAAMQALDTAKAALTRAEAEPDRLRIEAAEKRRLVEARKAHEMGPAARKRHAEAVAALDARQKRLEEQIAGAGDADGARLTLSFLADERKLIEGVEKDAADLGDEYRQAKERLEIEEIFVARALQIRADEVDRLRGQAERLKAAPCTEEDLWMGYGRMETGDELPKRDLAGTCPLLADARTAGNRLRELEASPACVEEAAARDAARARATELLARVDADLPKKQYRAGRLNEIAGVEDRLRKVIAGAEAAARAREDLAALAGERRDVDEWLAEAIEDAAAAVQNADEDLVHIEGNLSLDLVAANRRLEEARTAHADALHRHATAAAAAYESEGARVSERLTAANTALASATKARQDGEQRVRESDQAAARARARLDQLREREAALSPLRARAAAAGVDLGDWRLLEAGFGKDGIPQHKIDAAGPEVSAAATEILQVASGGVTSIAIETQSETLKGKAVEDFEIVIWDRGERRTVEDLSGGERVLVHEAISLACAGYLRRKSGIDWRTLFRDETAGALDAKSALAFAPMLRRAMEVGGFEQLVFICHNPDIVAAADVVVRVEEGRLTVGAERRAA